jgi:hypothetical protein
VSVYEADNLVSLKTLQGIGGMTRPHKSDIDNPLLISDCGIMFREGHPGEEVVTNGESARTEKTWSMSRRPASSGMPRRELDNRMERASQEISRPKSYILLREG